MDTRPTGTSIRRVHVLLAALVLAALGLGAYWNGLSVPFVYDDEPAITDNPRIRSLWPFGAAGYDVQSTESGRPLVRFTLAVNYALGELDVGEQGALNRAARALGIGTGGTSVRGYHLFNLAVHVSTALLLFGCVWRTLRAPNPSLARFHDAAPLLALSVAALWLVHPLQVDAVTYVIQRTELLMGFFYLATLYAAIRSTESHHFYPLPSQFPAELQSLSGEAGRSGATPYSWRWCLVSVVCCALGMASKEAMASAPILVALHDRAFAFTSWREVLRRRWPLYAGLASTWVLLAALILQGPRNATVGFALGVAWWEYALAQLGVILAYLRLVFWPDDLVLDYGRELARSAREIVPGALVVGALAAATLWALFRRPAWGFLGAWFFMILAPSSSFVPIINEVGAERRMHLPLAAVIVPLVLLGYVLAEAVLRRRSGARPHAASTLVACATALLVVALGATTVRRNADFASDLTIWLDTVEKRPDNPAARNNLGRAYAQRGRFEEALAQFSVAIRLPQCGVDAFGNYGKALTDLGRHEEAAAYFRALVRDHPTLCDGYEGLGLALIGLREWEEAALQLQQAVTCGLRTPELHVKLARAYFGMERIPEGIRELERALVLAPAHPVATQQLAEIRRILREAGAPLR